MAGWIKIDTEIAKHWLWQDAERLKWWLDILFMAAWKDRKQLIGKQLVALRRGQFIASLSFLCKRWGRSRSMVEPFLNLLQEEEMISKEVVNNISIITVLNYDKYQSNNSTKSDAEVSTEIGAYLEAPKNSCKSDKYSNPDAHLDADHKAYPDAHLDAHLDATREEYIDNKDNNIKKLSKESKEKKVAAKAATLARKDEFYNSLVPFIEKYGKETTRKFFDYWSEMNRSETKMRFELQPTWETSRRLVTWSNNDKKHSNARDKRTDENKRRGTQISATKAEDYSDTF